MQTLGCPTCGEPLVEGLEYCAKCGEAASSFASNLNLNQVEQMQEASFTPLSAASSGEQAPWPYALEVEDDTALSSERDTPASLNAIQEPGDTEATIRLPRNLTRSSPAVWEAGAETTLSFPHAQTRRAHPVPAAVDQDEAEVTLQLPHEAIARQQRQKETAQRPQFARPGAVRKDLDWDLQASLEETEYEDQDDEVVQHHGTWQKVVEHRNSATIPAVSRPQTLRQNNRPWSFFAHGKARAPRSVFWLSTVVLVALLLSGAFGLAVSFGRNLRKAVATPPPALQASPATIALGGIITLRGSHFTPQGAIALSRDQQISLVDTGGANTVRADAQGFFSDTVVADPSWLAGSHMLYAVDLTTHRRVLAPVRVTGTNALQGPPHLLLSANTLDLGSGDRITNASKLLALSNAGGGQATWQASVNQPWLSITPQQGSIASGKYLSALVTASRASLAPGFYQASIVFTSNTGQVALAVTLTVTPLRSSHEAIMQATPASLAFEGAARGDQPAPDTVTISNPGILPLTWSASISNAGWLWAAPSSGTIPAGGQQQVTVGVTTDGLGSGVYTGTLTFSNQGSQPVQGAPQSIYVSLTVTPACTLMLSTNSLNFSSQHNGANPASQQLHIGVASGCASSQVWSASSSNRWLTTDSSTGTTPSTTRVSINTSGLAPGIYNGALTFTNSLGSKMVEVTLTVTPIPCALSGPSAILLQGTAGQAGAAKQNVTISTAGDCLHTLNWSTTTSSSWLNAPSSGNFSGSTTLSIQADLSNLSAGTYSGSVTIAVVDSATNQSVGTLVVAVTLTAQAPPPPCTLQGPSSDALNFTASAGSSPAAPVASFTLSVTGSCSGNVTITPAVDSGSSGWLSVSGAVSIASGSGTTFTVTVDSNSLASGTYTGTITLDAGPGIAGSPRTVTVTLVVQ